MEFQVLLLCLSGSQTRQQRRGLKRPLGAVVGRVSFVFRQIRQIVNAEVDWFAKLFRQLPFPVGARRVLVE